MKSFAELRGARARLRWELAVALMLATCALLVTGCSGLSRHSGSEGRETVLRLFDGTSLAGWGEADFVGKGPVTVENGALMLGRGYMTGIVWTNDVPRMNYELTLEAQRVDGSDFFCGLTFPVGTNACSFVVGGWGGGVVGLSSIDGADASSNETTQYINFENGRWYAIRVRVTPEKIQAWIDGDPMADQIITGREVSIRLEMEPCVPLGVATWSTTGALRAFQLRTF